MVQGTTITKENKNDITIYSCCININKGIYYYKTYQNSQITAITMNKKEKTKETLSVYNLVKEQQVKYEN